MKEDPSKPNQYVLLEGIKHLNRFFTTYSPGEDPAKLKDGTVVYRILGYADTTAEVQMKLYGRTFP